VWLPNIRGNTYSTNNTHLSPDQSEVRLFAPNSLSLPPFSLTLLSLSLFSSSIFTYLLSFGIGALMRWLTLIYPLFSITFSTYVPSYSFYFIHIIINPIHFTLILINPIDYRSNQIVTRRTLSGNNDGFHCLREA
jgi:hypothetical protein